MTAYPAGDTLPLASNLNPERAGQNIPNLVTVPIGTDGQIAVYTLTQADIIVDAFGYYTPATTAKAGATCPPAPCGPRLAQSRGPLAAGERSTCRSTSSSTRTPPPSCSTSRRRMPSATALHGVRSRDEPAADVDLNVVKGGTVPNQVIVPVSKTGVDIYAFAGGHVIVDVFGYFTGSSAASSSDGLFVPVAPTRFLDTRTDDNPLGPKQRLFAGWTVEMNVIGRSGIPFNVARLVANTTVVNTRDAGLPPSTPPAPRGR